MLLAVPPTHLWWCPCSYWKCNAKKNFTIRRNIPTFCFKIREEFFSKSTRCIAHHMSTREMSTFKSFDCKKIEWVLILIPIYSIIFETATLANVARNFFHSYICLGCKLLKLAKSVRTIAYGCLTKVANDFHKTIFFPLGLQYFCANSWNSSIISLIIP